MVVTVPVVDLRAQPRTVAQPNVHDPLQETQLLYGEWVRLIKRSDDGWAQVQAVEQPEYTHQKKWEGYPGWVPSASLVPWDGFLEPEIVVVEKWAVTWKDAYGRTRAAWRFPLGARLAATEMGGQLWRVELLDGEAVWLPSRAARSLRELRTLPPSEKRQLILRSAALLVGDPYYWGGRSPFSPDLAGQVTGVDCSGLIHLAYRTAGIELPRDAHEQFLRAMPLNSPRPADLIFLSERGDPQRVIHVMLYAGDGMIIEGPGTGQTVRRVPVEQRLGQPIERLAPGAVIDGQTISFGAYLP